MGTFTIELSQRAVQQLLYDAQILAGAAVLYVPHEKQNRRVHLAAERVAKLLQEPRKVTR